MKRAALLMTLAAIATLAVAHEDMRRGAPNDAAPAQRAAPPMHGGGTMGGMHGGAMMGGMHGGGMMGNMMGQDMSAMMDGCRDMMQGGGSSRRPNDQWRAPDRRTPAQPRPDAP